MGRIYVLLLHVNSSSIAGKGLFLKIARPSRAAEWTPVRASMERPNTVPLPTAKDRTNKSLAILQPGHFPNIVETESMANVVD